MSEPEKSSGYSIVHKTLEAYPPEKIEELEQAMLDCPEQVETPTFHHFAPGTYVREARFPAGTFALGHRHKTEHTNILLQGKISVLSDGVVKTISAPYIFKSPAGERKLAYFHEDTRWLNVHHTNATTVEAAEEDLIVKSATFLKCTAAIAAEDPKPLT